MRNIILVVIVLSSMVMTAPMVLNADIITIDGVVKSVDSDKRTITVESGAKVRTLDVSSKAKFVINEKDEGIDALKAGQRVTLSFHDQLEVVVKVESTVLPIDADENDFISLFDGKSLNGWKGNTKHWSVDDGAIVGEIDRSVSGGSFLISTKKFDDFELRLKFDLLKGNSGVQIRSREHENFLVSGYQADIAYGNFKWMGALVAEKVKAEFFMPSEHKQEILRKTVVQDDWNEMTIIAKGKSIRIDVNGITSVASEVSEIPDKGIIAFQLHGGGPTTVKFKDINIREIR